MKKKLVLSLCITMGIFVNVGCAQASIETSAQNKSGVDVYYIDVGQADACLIQSGGHSMLIDAGNNDDEKLIVDFLTQKGVTKIDYAIGTHPHEDHIGGLDAVIDAFEIDKIYMPKISATTKTFTDVLTSIENKKLSVTTPTVGERLDFNGMPITILAPGQKYKDINDNSITLKLTNQDISFLFTGDIEAKAEKDILATGADISANVLKVAHHGSETSSTVEFLEAVKPEYAIISLGKDNKYGHPDDSTIKNLEKMGTKILRTDESGTIHVSTYENNVTVDTAVK